MHWNKTGNADTELARMSVFGKSLVSINSNFPAEPPKPLGKKCFDFILLFKCRVICGHLFFFKTALFLTYYIKKNCVSLTLLFRKNGHSQDNNVVSHQQERARWNAWPFPLRFNHPSKKASQERSCKIGGSGEKRKMNHTMSSLCHLAYCERHKSEQWCLSGGSLYAHLHWFGSSIHETGTLFIHTLLN